MKNIKTFSALVIAFLFFAPALFAQGDFVSAKEFSTLIKNKNTKVISAQSSKNYKTSHIKGSVHVDHHDLYKKSGPEGMLLSSSALAAYFGKKGISNTNTIIIYDDGKNKYASRVYWILKYLGAKNVKLLHKDMKTWRAARIPLTKTATSVKPVKFTASVNKSVIVDAAYVKAHLKDPKVVIVDVRHITEYNGTSPKPVSKGHIPGAVNVNWKDMINANGSLKSKEELKKIFASKGITSGKTIVLYCATSVRTGIEYVALKSILGYPNVKVYDGAYNEWDSLGYKFEK
jgi:thiosulfate/3-mercaptopyruvate sulfurtransferase